MVFAWISYDQNQRTTSLTFMGNTRAYKVSDDIATKIVKW